MKRLFAALGVIVVCTGLPTSPVNAEEEKKEKFKLSGDLRGRFEAFRFSEDELGNKKDTRLRIRYRLRLNLTANLNPHAQAKVRVGTGDVDHRSGNQTLGSPLDFGPNEFDVRRAYLVLMPYANGKLPDDKGTWSFQFGRTPNPFLWKNGKDIMLWDNDINPAGVSTTLDYEPGSNVSAFANAAYFVIKENSSDKDPYLAALQIGLEGGSEDGLMAGIRGTFYAFDNLDSLFIKRGVDGSGAATSSGGNIRDGLTDSADGGTLNVIETQLYVTTNTWNLLAFGGFSTNLSAESSQLFPDADKQNLAYNVGLQGGDKKEFVMIGGAYYHVEANAFPSQFIDSDLFDGVTNRRGALIYLTRYVLKGVDFKFTGFASDAIETTSGFGDSVKDSERTRFQVDLVYKF